MINVETNIKNIKIFNIPINSLYKNPENELLKNGIKFKLKNEYYYNEYNFYIKDVFIEMLISKENNEISFNIIY